MNRLIIAILFTSVFSLSYASVFSDNFCDSTLRVDYIFGADSSGSHIMLSKQNKLKGWAGRKNNLKELPLQGTGIITVTDAELGDTIYRSSFSSLFSEWLSTPEAETTPSSFENSYLIPLPRRSAKIHIKLLDSRHQTIAEMSHLYRPDDVLIIDKTGTTPQPHKYIHTAKDQSNAIDVAILAEGYTVAEMDSFFRHASVAVESILAHEPFKTYSDRFNFIAVASPSNDSGVSVPRFSDWKNTACGSNFSTFYSDRYLTTNKVHGVHDLLTGIPYEHIIILANTDEYGGGGIYNSYTLTTARHKMFRPVVVHEFGHSFGGLADEYFYDNDVMTDSYPLDIEPWEQNITTLVDFTGKWKSLLPDKLPVPTPTDLSTTYPVGLYEGGGYSSKGIYRPADVCRMRNNTAEGFCPACRKAITELILFYTE
ncbi:MAG: IgA Peptidase M64 [Muribaculaceae bacterium]|nr:IgA Peptidase M64 [Muribaculaceae bacterium]